MFYPLSPAPLLGGGAGKGGGVFIYKNTLGDKHY